MQYFIMILFAATLILFAVSAAIYVALFVAGCYLLYRVCVFLFYHFNIDKRLAAITERATRAASAAEIQEMKK